jgi:predicted dehydrogenase
MFHMKRGLSRRSILQSTAALSAGYWVAGGIAPRVSLAANETINFASVGVGGKGSSDSGDAGSNGNMVAICDIDDGTLGKAGLKWPNAKKYNDFRKMLEENEKSIDAVTVSTPDHCHAVVAAMAMRMGKACFTQKPLTKTIYEARYLTNLAKEKKVATQMGNQGTANDPLRRAAAILKSGKLGNVKSVHVWTNRPVWPQGKGLVVKESEAPASIHWNEFIGPAKMRGYSSEIHPFKWRGFWDFGTGALGDMACHTLNMPFMGLNLRDPVTLQATTDGHDGVTFPKWSIIEMDYPELNGRAALKFHWYDGGKRPDASLFPADFFKPDEGEKKGMKMSSSGALIIGDKDSLYAPGDYAEQKLYMLSGGDVPEVEFPKSPGHFKEWVEAIKGGPEAMSNFPNYAGPLTETVLLGNLAVWCAPESGVPSKKIEWDAAALTAKNAPEAAHLIKYDYNNGYKLEG